EARDERLDGERLVVREEAARVADERLARREWAERYGVDIGGRSCAVLASGSTAACEPERDAGRTDLSEEALACDAIVRALVFVHLAPSARRGTRRCPGPLRRGHRGRA